MEKLITLINEIHDILYQSNLSNALQLPQIVVIGAQSTGKSSLLESIVGRDFLPRGKGIVTRCPIEIQLINNAKSENKEYVIFQDKPHDVLTNMTDVLATIKELTEKMAGQQKTITEKPIKIKFYSPNVLELLIVDLPGMTKNPVGDQPKEIEQLVKNLIIPYVKNPNSLILAVSKANDDLANSESLKLAREVDPTGDRTIGVITQIDIMDEGSDVMNELMNQTYPLKLGYVGVVLRGEKNKQQNISISEQVEIEKQFFDQHKAYNKFSMKMGVPYLIKTLNLNFIKHIKKSLPNIRNNLIELINVKEYEIKQYGPEELIEGKQNQGLLILSLISKYAKAYAEQIKGQYIKFTNDELLGGARVNYIFIEIFRKKVDEIDPFDHISDDEIRIAIKNANGLRPALFIPEGAFENLVKQQIMRLQQPSLECSNFVFQELRRILYTINVSDIQRYENLNNAIFQVMEDVLQKCLMPTNEMIRHLIEIELGYINTNHPDFVGGTSALITIQQQIIEDEYKQKSQEENNKNQQKNVQQQQQQQQVNQKQSQQLNKEVQKSGGIYSWMPFMGQGAGTSQQTNQVLLFDNKLNQMQMNQQQQQENSKQTSFKSQIHYASKGIISDDFLIDNLNYHLDPKQILPSVPQRIVIQGKPTQREKTENEMIKKLIKSYYDVVKKNVNDSVPKTIVTLLVNQSMNICERELISNLYDSEKYDGLLEQNSYVAIKRKEVSQTLSILKNSLNVLNSIDAKF